MSSRGDREFVCVSARLTHDGINLSSNRQNCLSRSIMAAGSKVGRAIRALLRFNLAIFISGRNNLTRPILSLYAFMPSKHSKA